MTTVGLLAGNIAVAGAISILWGLEGHTRMVRSLGALELAKLFREMRESNGVREALAIFVGPSSQNRCELKEHHKAIPG